jgi:hypothetical protein
MVGLYNKPGRGSKRIFNPSQESIREWALQEPRQLKLVLEKIKKEWELKSVLKQLREYLKDYL